MNKKWETFFSIMWSLKQRLSPVRLIFLFKLSHFIINFYNRDGKSLSLLSMPFLLPALSRSLPKHLCMPLTELSPPETPIQLQRALSSTGRLPSLSASFTWKTTWMEEMRNDLTWAHNLPEGPERARQSARHVLAYLNYYCYYHYHYYHHHYSHGALSGIHCFIFPTELYTLLGLGLYFIVHDCH